MKALRDCGMHGQRLPASAAIANTYSLDNLPDLNSFQSTLPPPSFQSSPSATSNSSCVRPGASLRTMTFSLGAEALLCNALEGSFVEAPFCVADAGIERMPCAEGVLSGLEVGAWSAGEVMMCA